jgi:hypothetical protein
MYTTATSGIVPAPRGRAVATPLGLAALRAATYIEFLLGHGEAPGMDLGSPLAFDHVDTVYSQRFAHGLTLANVGPEAVQVSLEHPYYDLTHALRTSVTLPGHSAEVLLSTDVISTRT